MDELILRMRGYGGWEEEYWLSDWGDFWGMVEYVGWKEIEDVEEELGEDMEEIWRGEGLRKEKLKEWVVKGGELEG
ncbi:CbrC family protein [Bacillus sp. WP8]|uniref:CbrC family protein n=1 Tax=Bacillus sp. WP8 TaxID=756828 RepID=UPI0021B19FDC|nr:CbrC family protein [Bacillus sp. WP8]